LLNVALSEQVGNSNMNQRPAANDFNWPPPMSAARRAAAERNNVGAGLYVHWK